MQFIITEVNITLLHSYIHMYAFFPLGFRAWKKFTGIPASTIYVKPTIQEQPGQGRCVPSLQSNTDFPLKGKFSISKDLIVWSFKNNSRWLNFRIANILLQINIFALLYFVLYLSPSNQLQYSLLYCLPLSAGMHALCRYRYLSTLWEVTEN